LPEVDVLRATSQVASAELLLRRARELVEVSKDELRSTMHDASGARYEIGEDPLAPALPLPRESIDALYARSLARRPEIAALEAMGLSLAEEQATARAATFPRLDAFGNGYYANPNQRYIPQEERWHATWDAGVQLTWSPNDLGSSTAAVRAVEARRAKLSEEKHALEEALRREIVQTYQDVRTAEFAVRTAIPAVRAAEEAYRGRRLMFEQGRATTVELVDAETELVRARFERVNAHLDLLTSRARLGYAIGDTPR
jgi:outer membrane protein TolC